MRTLALALVHYPVCDRQGDVVTAAITNIDLHDISRSAHTYGASGLYIVHPIAAQRELAERIRSHWVDGSGARRIPDRKPAMQQLHVVESLDAAVVELGDETELWTTSAQPGPRNLSFEAARALLGASGPPLLLCFGTGWGLAPEIHDRAAARLAPITSPRADGYNHLSVRAAAAITLDRLLGRGE